MKRLCIASLAVTLPLVSAGCGKDSTPPKKVAASLSISSATTSVAAGVSLAPVAVTVLDAAGDLVDDATNLITIAIATNPGGSSLSGTVAVNAIGGVATFTSLSLNHAAAGYTLQASSPGLNSATTAAFDVVPGDPATMAFVSQPTNAVAGIAISPGVTVRFLDALQNVATQVTATVSVSLGTNPGSATLLGTQTVSAVAGVATFPDLSIQKAGSGYTLAAASPGLTAVSSDAFSVLPAPAASVSFGSVPPAQLDATQDFTMIASLIDQFGNPATTETRQVTLSLGASAEGAALVGTTTVAPSGGAATFHAYVDRPATGLTLSAAVDSLPPAVTDPFDVTLRLARITTGGGADAAHTCGLTQYSRAFCWGSNNAGQLGDGTNTERSAPVPVMMPAGVTFFAISAGSHHTCAIANTTLEVYCWGDNSSGQLGDGTMSQRTVPTLVSGSTGFQVISAGDSHTCGRTNALVGYCWGSNGFGEIGDGSKTQREAPAVAVLPGGARFGSAMSADSSHSCGVTDVYAAFCWGDNARGQSGESAGAGSSTPAPVAMPTGVDVWFSLETGALHTCGLSTAFQAYCFGANDSGQLGDGTNSSSAAPVPVTGGTFDQVSVGWFHACGIASGAVSCWGANGSGQLGDNSATDRSAPVPVSAPAGTTFVSVAAGRDHTCALTSAFVVYCWGRNDHGQLGDGTTTQRLIPVKGAGSP